MMRVCIVCEGATEANFVKECLSPHLADRGVYAYASILQAPSGNHKGGRVLFAAWAVRLWQDHPAAHDCRVRGDILGGCDD